MNIFKRLYNWFNVSFLVEFKVVPRKRGRLKKEEKIKIIYWNNIGLNAKQIVDISGRSIATVYNLIREHKKQG